MEREERSQRTGRALLFSYQFLWLESRKSSSSILRPQRAAPFLLHGDLVLGRSPSLPLQSQSSQSPKASPALVPAEGLPAAHQSGSRPHRHLPGAALVRNGARAPPALLVPTAPQQPRLVPAALGSGHSTGLKDHNPETPSGQLDRDKQLLLDCHILSKEACCFLGGVTSTGRPWLPHAQSGPVLPCRRAGSALTVSPILHTAALNYKFPALLKGNQNCRDTKGLILH